MNINPCPFCDDKKVVVSPPSNDPGDDIVLQSWQVYCHFCGAAGPRGETEEEAIKAWNNPLNQEEICNAQSQRINYLADLLSKIYWGDSYLTKRPQK